MDNKIQINFYCLGVQKAGTSTLFQLLKQHKDVFLPIDKEAHYFDWDRLYKPGLNWYYNKFFKNCHGEKIIGTITPSYLYSEKVPNRIKVDIGEDIKFIVILRNPAERAWSQYLMNVRDGIENLAFEEAIKKEQKRIKESEYADLNFSYTNRGFYSKQLKRYFELFGSQNFLILSFEKDIVDNQQETMSKICGFLNICAYDFDYSVNKNEFKPKKTKLEHIFRRIIGFTNKMAITKTEFGRVDNLFKSKTTKPKLKDSTREHLLDNVFATEIIELSSLLKVDYKEIWS